MTPTSLFKRYVWLLELLLNSKDGYSLKEINESLARENEEEIPRRTFIRTKAAIEDIFSVQIKYNRQRDKYYIENSKETHEMLYSAFAVNRLMSENLDLNDRIILEKAATSSNKFLSKITTAMRDCQRILITYHSYEMQTAREFEIEPYALRYFGRRWYVLAHTDFHTSLHLYALDRMDDVKITNKFFKLPADFYADDYFSRYFGVIMNDGKAEKILLRTTDLRTKYLNSLPLHSTQKEVAPNLFELCLVLTDDFINALRAMGAEVEVVSPDWLRKRLLKDAKEMVKKYSKKIL